MLRKIPLGGVLLSVGSIDGIRLGVKVGVTVGLTLGARLRKTLSVG